MREPTCFYDACPHCTQWLNVLEAQAVPVCAVCKDRPISHTTGPHSKQDLADHMRAELARRGYPDPWREKGKAPRV